MEREAMRTAIATPLLDQYLEMREQLTDMMNQYLDTKVLYRDAVLLYRLGDFYEMFLDDAVLASSVLDLVLTGRNCGLGKETSDRAPMCGIPYHSVEPYIAKLVENGYKVAICEQLEDPKQTKGIVRRDVIRVITPGTVIDPAVLDESRNNYLCSVFRAADGVGVSFADVSTGEVFCVQFSGKNCLLDLHNERAKYLPVEMIINPEGFSDRRFKSEVATRFQLYPEEYHDWAFGEREAAERIRRQYGIDDLESLGLVQESYAARSLGALLYYLYDTQKTELAHMSAPVVARRGEFMELDPNTRRNLELTATLRSGQKRGSLIWVLDETKTAMGARLLRRWMEQPLLDCLQIRRRHEAVGVFCQNASVRQEMGEALSGIRDLERILARIVYENANCRDLVALKESARLLPKVLELISGLQSGLLQQMCREFDTLDDIAALIDRAIVDNPPFSLREGGLIKEGFNARVDSYREAMEGGREWISRLEQEQREATGIRNLRIGYNKVFGYFIEVTRSQIELVPEHYIRKQTLANCERYITQELKDIETTVLEAEEKRVQLEYDLYNEVRLQIAEQLQRIQKAAHLVATTDVLRSLAEVADRNGYACPEVDESDRIVIRDGRHPVIEQMQRDSLFVPNDTELDTKENQIAVITGPNMAGKSTYMRQVALIALMAQMGSFVPAGYARIGVCDKIFTRVGASDDLASGQSTFMVEMNEVANILKHATGRSLLVLDEIGRGTSTYDGLSIAWAVIEYIEGNRRLHCRTLFATHYHELTELENKLSGVRNYCIAVKKRGDDITFLRKIIRGGADSSYGIEVALLAGVPREVTARAKEIQQSLRENDIARRGEAAPAVAPAEENAQVGIFALAGEEVTEEILRVDLSTLTPIEALNKLYELQNRLKSKD